MHLTQQNTFLFFLDESDKNFLNLVLAVFKFYIYKLRVSSRLILNTFLHHVVRERNIEKRASFKNQQKLDIF